MGNLQPGLLQSGSAFCVKQLLSLRGRLLIFLLICTTCRAQRSTSQRTCCQSTVEPASRLQCLLCQTALRDAAYSYSSSYAPPVSGIWCSVITEDISNLQLGLLQGCSAFCEEHLLSLWCCLLRFPLIRPSCTIFIKVE